ncbi:MAG: hypothetical protein NW200_13975 [Hyphomonadaceae bacterium]|nr:hypothetical protein [Hyphomonadaceae bacterium]
MRAGPVLGARELGQRLRDYGLSTLAQVAALIMGAVFSTAALCFVAILQSPELQILRLSIWFVGILNCWLALTRILHAGLTHARPSASHLPLVLIWGLLATINFALISEETGGVDGWRHVYLVSVLLMLVSAALTYVESDTASAERFDPAIGAVLSRRIKEFRAPLFSTIPSAALCGGLYYVALIAKTEPHPWLMALLVSNIVGCVSFAGFIFAEMASFRRFVDGVEAANAAGAHDQTEDRGGHR